MEAATYSSPRPDFTVKRCNGGRTLRWSVSPLVPVHVVARSLWNVYLAKVSRRDDRLVTTDKLNQLERETSTC